MLPPLRSGVLGLASFADLLPLQIALAAVVLPLLALLAGAELLAGEIEDGTLVPALVLPISRRECFAGKCLGRAAVLTSAYLAAFAGAGLAVALRHGPEGGAGWLAVAGAGLLLVLSAGALGAAAGARGRGRVRAFGAALALWVGLVFVLDAILLTAIVALAPPPPAAGRPDPADDPHAREGEARGPAARPGARLFLTLAAGGEPGRAVPAHRPGGEP